MANSSNYYNENKEKFRQYYQVNKEKIKERIKKYNKNNKNTIKKRSKQYYINNKESIKKKNREYSKKNFKIYYHNNKEKMRIKNREKYKKHGMPYYHRRRILIYDEYGNECSCCGERNQLFLTLDHVNNDGKKHKDKTGRRLSGNRLYDWIIINNFPDIIQLLCYNCNMGKARNKGICPHQIG